MSKLKRNARRYKEIETFKDYELTQCVVYEMAIRSSAAERPMSLIQLNIPLDREGVCTDKTSRVLREGYSINTNLVKYEERTVVKKQDQVQKTTVVPEHYSSGGICISENFKRPKLDMDKLKSVQATMEIELNKPLSEIIALVTHIKNDLYKNKDLLKAPIELLGNELQKADDLSNMCIETKNGIEKCFDGRNGVTRTQKLADMFFIYDMVKQGKKELKIRTAISEYYEGIGKKTETSDATFRKYRDIALDYIDNERYKELVTGVKS